MRVQENVTPSVVEQQTKSAAKLAEQNRKVLTSLFDCMKLCVAQGFATRGHRDTGLPTIDDDEFSLNMGNFKAIVAFRARSGDKDISAHMEKCAKNATYMSNTAQAQMLECILAKIQESVVQEAKNQHGRFIFAVSGDEVTDVTTTEQLAIVLRTVSADGFVKERLLEYVNMESIRGEDISKAIIDSKAITWT